MLSSFAASEGLEGKYLHRGHFLLKSKTEIWDYLKSGFEFDTSVEILIWTLNLMKSKGIAICIKIQPETKIRNN